MTRNTILLGAAVLAVMLAGVIAGFFLLAPTGVDSSPTASPTPTRSASPTPSPAPTATPTPTASAALAPPPAPPAPVCADDVLTCVNIARAENGLGALSADATLNTAAQSCAERIAAQGFLSHSSPTPGFSTWGENIASGYPTAADVFAGWMGSDGHRANILGASYTVMGVGFVASGSYWCQQFGG